MHIFEKQPDMLKVIRKTHDVHELANNMSMTLTNI